MIMVWYKNLKIRNVLGRILLANNMDMSKIPEENKNGDCYCVAANYVVDNAILRGQQNLTLVHGEVIGQGAIAGIQYGHAWVEDGDTVIDISSGRDIRIPKFLYYAVGNIEKTIRYTPEETRKMLLKYEHYGPWK
jgi:hypothetical protein